jgi:nitrate reductase NapD
MSSVSKGTVMPDEVHISGMIVHADPARLADIRARIAQVPKARVHADPGDGRLVITLETGSTKRTLDYMDALRALPGVINVALVYQHAEPATDMDEELE